MGGGAAKSRRARQESDQRGLAVRGVASRKGISSGDSHGSTGGGTACGCSADSQKVACCAKRRETLA